MQVRKQQLELDMEQRIGSKLGKEFVKAIYGHPASLTYVEYITQKGGMNEAQAEIKIGWGGISTTSDMQMTPLLWCKVKRN